MRIAYNYHEFKKRFALSNLSVTTKVIKVYLFDDHGYLLETDSGVDLGFIDLSISENLVCLNTRTMSKEARTILDSLGVTFFSLEEHIPNDFVPISTNSIGDTAIYGDLTLPSDFDKEGDVYHKTSGYKVGTYLPSKHFKTGYIKFFPNKEDAVFLTQLAESKMSIHNTIMDGTYLF